METLDQTLVRYEKLVSDQLKVDNPILLKTGVLGTLANIFANVKYDANIYFNKLIKEINPATAEDFSSLLFHSSILNQNIDFAIPATFDITFIVPDIKITDNQLITYTISRNNTLTDTYGFKYTLENDIHIYISGSGVQGKAFTNEGLQALKVDKVVNPTSNNSYIYLVSYSGLRQYQREFHTFAVPEYNVGEAVTFTIPVNKENIYDIRVWYKPTQESNTTDLANYNLTETELYGYDSNDLSIKFGLNELNVKYSKHLSTQYDNDVFMNIKDDLLEFQIGDGYNGQKRLTGETIYIEVKTTKGEEANINSTEWVVNKVLVQTESDARLSNTSLSLKAVSLSGGEGGISFSGIEEIRRNLLKKARSRGSLISTMDFINEYELDNGIPFVDSKYLNSKSNVFIFNIMRDFNKKILPTTTYNIPEVEFDQNLFYPRKVISGITLISPFLYRKRNNQYDAYLINPEVKINLQTNVSNKITKISNLIDVFITYDYILQKSKIELRNYNAGYTYIFRCNLFTMTLNKDNNFQQEISTLFTDEYCLIDEELTYVNGYAKGLTDIRVDVLNKFVLDSEIPSNSNTVEWADLYIMNWYSSEKHFQTKLKQSNFLYIDTDDYNSTIETRHVMHLPFLEETFFSTNDRYKVFTKIDNFFKIIENKQMFPFNLEVTQAFYNTITLDDKYKDFILDINNSALDVVPKLRPIITIIIDKTRFNLSEYQTIEEVETTLKLLLVKTFSTLEGFNIEYFESYIESVCLKAFPIIKNIEVVNPKALTIKPITSIYYNMEDSLGTNFDIKDILDFTPPYFHFDYDNMFIKIVLD